MKKTGIALAIGAAPLIMVLVCAGTVVVMVMATIAGAVASLTGATSVLPGDVGRRLRHLGPSVRVRRHDPGRCDSYADLNEAQRRNSTVIIGARRRRWPTCPMPERPYCPVPVPGGP